MPKNFDLTSHTLVFGDFDTEWYKFWAGELKQQGKGLQQYKLLANKFWQNAVMAQVLYERGVLKKGAKAIGFGVGKERLPALFADYGVNILATDQDFRSQKAKLWAKDELAKNLDDLNGLGICSPRKFKDHVSLQSLDMNKIPKSLRGKFDFAWSNCALGHLGSIDAGLDFIVNSAECLKPNGVAVHTTEVNVISNRETATSGGTVIFRPKDLLKLHRMLSRKGFELEVPGFNLGSSEQDQRISFKPEFGNDYSKILVSGHLATQIVLIIKGRGLATNTGLGGYFKHVQAYKANLNVQKQFIQNHELLGGMIKSAGASLRHSLAPTKRKYSVSLGKKPEPLYVEFKNNSPHFLFSAHTRLHNVQPVVLSTSDPLDRHSIFFSEDWLNNSPARAPSPYYVKDKSGKWLERSYVKPGEKFAFRLTLTPPKPKTKAEYIENFCLAQETVEHFVDTGITLKIKT